MAIWHFFNSKLFVLDAHELMILTESPSPLRSPVARDLITADGADGDFQLTDHEYPRWVRINL